MHKQRLGLLISSVAGMLAIFLPWANNPFHTVSPNILGISISLGWIAFVLFAFLFTISCFTKEPPDFKIKFLKRKNIQLSNADRIVATVAALLAAVFGIISLVNFEKLISNNSTYAVGIGIYLTIFAGVAACIIALVLGDKPS